MIKIEELNNPNSCINKAKNDEMVFVLLGRDIAAPAAIQEWINQRIFSGKNSSQDEQIKEAYNAKYKMILYQQRLFERTK